MRRALRLGAALVALVTTLAATAAPALASVSFSQIQSEFMCTVCHESLPVARSPEAYTENAYLRQLIAQGRTEPQIKRIMVAQFGEGVLAQPPATGLGVLLYVIPPVVIVLGLGVVAYTVPRWRRRTRDRAAEPRPDGPQISDEDAQRLDADLARTL